LSDIVKIGDATLYHGDCLEILPTLDKVNALITDPPFGVGNFVQTSGNVRGEAVEWNESGPPAEWFEIVKQKSTYRIIWGANFFNCFEVKGGAIVWYKHQKMPNVSKCEIASSSYLQKTEYISLPWTNFDATHKKVTSHPCERPVGLYEWCIDYLPITDTVLDTFMGSGSCGVAAANLGKKFIGIEIERKYFDIACERIEAAYAQGRLFA